MAKRKLMKRIIIGAVIGGATALMNKDVRKYAKDKLIKVKDQTKFVIQNPSEIVKNTRINLMDLTDAISEHTTNTIETLSHIEETLDHFTKND